MILISIKLMLFRKWIVENLDCFGIGTVSVVVFDRFYKRHLLFEDVVIQDLLLISLSFFLLLHFDSIILTFLFLFNI